MSMETELKELVSRQRQLDEVLHILYAALRGVPAEQRLAPASQRAATVLELIGWGKDGMRAAGNALVSVASPIDLEEARKELIRAQQIFNNLFQQFIGELVAYNAVAELYQLGQEHGGGWPEWVEGVRQLVHRCEHLLYDVNQALFGCWREMAEHAGKNSVSVRNTTIGQRITMRDPKQQLEPGIT